MAAGIEEQGVLVSLEAALVEQSAVAAGSRP
jgi:hypothetical protein